MSRLDSLWTDKSEEIENLTEVGAGSVPGALSVVVIQVPLLIGSLEESGFSSGKNKENHEDG